MGLTLNALRSIDISQVLVGSGTIGSLRIQDIGRRRDVDRLLVNRGSLRQRLPAERARAAR